MNGARLALSFLDESFDHRNPSQLRRAFLERARLLVDYDHATFISYTEEFFSTPPEYVVRYLTSPTYRRNIARAFEVARRQGGLYIDTEVFSPRERGELPFFQDVINPYRIRSQLVAACHFGGRISGVIHFNREGRPYRDEDAARLRPLLSVIGVAHAALESGRPAPASEARPRLSPREREVAELVARGLTNRAIAGVLGTSIHTVRRQVETVLGKCAASRRAEIASLAARGLLLEPTVPRLPPGVDARVVHHAWTDIERSSPG